jgi:light-regulated signal transduction histidine kinase (bacteriophytochrome)
LEPFQRRYRRRDGGELWAEIHDILVRDAAGQTTGMRSALLDITERKRLAEDLERHAERLARSNAELERFAFVASHDLQEPLRMVASFTQLLAKRYSGRLDETADRYIDFAVDGAKRMQQLIIDLLTYSRLNSRELDLQRIECEAVVQTALQNLSEAIDASGAAITQDPLPVLTADAAQLGQLFQNLIGNAIKFRGNAPLRIHIAATGDGPDWRFSVQDNGIGIDPGHTGRIFQVFQRLHTREQYPGTGIGLAVCQKVAERHGGKIWVESEPGVGSTFHFTIPKLGKSE